MYHHLAVNEIRGGIANLDCPEGATFIRLSGQRPTE